MLNILIQEQEVENSQYSESDSFPELQTEDESINTLDSEELSDIIIPQEANEPKDLSLSTSSNEIHISNLGEGMKVELCVVINKDLFNISLLDLHKNVYISLFLHVQKIYWVYEWIVRLKELLRHHIFKPVKLNGRIFKSDFKPD